MARSTASTIPAKKIEKPKNIYDNFATSFGICPYCKTQTFSYRLKKCLRDNCESLKRNEMDDRAQKPPLLREDLLC